MKKHKKLIIALLTLCIFVGCATAVFAGDYETIKIPIGGKTTTKATTTVTTTVTECAHDYIVTSLKSGTSLVTAKCSKCGDTVEVDFSDYCNKDIMTDEYFEAEFLDQNLDSIINAKDYAKILKEHQN